MGFLRRLFGSKKPKDKSKSKSKSKWVPTSNTEFPPSHALSAAAALDANKHAIAVAAATAAVAEAALAAAHAAAEVVRLTNSGSAAAGSSAAAVRFSRARSLASVTIQSAFRGYLARRALRALKALVKLQALVRGNIVRKQTADMLRRMQTLVRLQARARAGRAHSSESLNSSRRSSLPNYPFPENADRIGLHQRASTGTKYDVTSILKRSDSNANVREVPKTEKTKTGSNWLDHWMEESIWKDNKNHQIPSNRYLDHEAKNDKILEVDTWRPHLDSQRSTRSFQMPRSALASDYHNHNNSFAQFESPSKRSSRDETQQQSFSASSRPGSSGGGRRGPFTPAKSERSWGYFSAYSSHPNYMANTESSRAKVRSQSAPRQRQELSRHSASKKSTHGFWDGWEHPDSNVDVDLRGSVYPSFNPVDRLGSATLR